MYEKKPFHEKLPVNNKHRNIEGYIIQLLEFNDFEEIRMRV